MHVDAGAKNAADAKLRQSIRRFAQINKSPATVILITGKILLWLYYIFEFVDTTVYFYLDNAMRHFKQEISQVNMVCIYS